MQLLTRTLLLFALSAFASASVPACFDEEPECAAAAATGACFPSGLATDSLSPLLSVCRPSCRRYLRDNAHRLSAEVLRHVEYVGGLDDVVVDTLNHTHHICDVANGYTAERRRHVIRMLVYSHMALNGETLWSRQFTRVGFMTEPAMLNETVLHRIAEFNSHKEDFCDNRRSTEPSTIEDDGYECRVVEAHDKLLKALPDDLMADLVRAVKPVAEEFARSDGAVVALVPTSVRGIVRYYRNSLIESHIDRGTTLSVTCSVGLGQDLDAPFPFSIMDYGGRRHDYAVDPGHIVCFEGSTLPHGRLHGLKGRFYDVILVGFRAENGQHVYDENLLDSLKAIRYQY